MVETTCGARSIQIIAASEADPGPVLGRMAQGLDCHPDPTREVEIAAGQAPVGFDQIPLNWYASSGDDGGIFTIESDGGVAAFLPVPDTASLQRVDLALAVKLMFERFSGGSWKLGDRDRVERHGRTRDLMLGTATVDGEELAVVASMWPCPGKPGVLAFVIYPIDGDREAAADVIMRAHCLRAGEPPPSLPKRLAEDGVEAEAAP